MLLSGYGSVTASHGVNAPQKPPPAPSHGAAGGGAVTGTTQQPPASERGCGLLSHNISASQKALRSQKVVPKVTLRYRSDFLVGGITLQNVRQLFAEPASPSPPTKQSLLASWTVGTQEATHAGEVLSFVPIGDGYERMYLSEPEVTPWQRKTFNIGIGTGPVMYVTSFAASGLDLRGDVRALLETLHTGGTSLGAMFVSQTLAPRALQRSSFGGRILLSGGSLCSPVPSGKYSIFSPDIMPVLDHGIIRREKIHAIGDANGIVVGFWNNLLVVAREHAGSGNVKLWKIPGLTEAKPAHATVRPGRLTHHQR